MKTFRTTLNLTFFFLSASAAHGSPLLVPGTLNDYIALGSSGGQIGDVIFSDFSLLGIPTEAAPIDPSAVMVIPINDPLGPALQFVVNQMADAGQFFDIRIGFLVSNSSFSGTALSMAGSSATGDGAVTAVGDLWPNGDVLDLFLFSPADLSLITFSIAGLDDTAEQTNFSPVANLAVAVDIGVDGGRPEVDPEGTAALSAVTSQFRIVSVIPEPATLALVAAGLGCMGACRRRRA